MVADLDPMLNGSGGVEIGAVTISALYYIDYIILFTENEQNWRDVVHILNILARNGGSNSITHHQLMLKLEQCFMFLTR